MRRLLLLLVVFGHMVYPRLSARTPGLDFQAFLYNDAGTLQSTKLSNRFYVGNMDIALGLNTREAGWWDHGQFTFYIFSKYGDSPSQQMLSDIQGFTNIETAFTTRVLELAYTHHFEKLTLVLGQHDLNKHMARSRLGYDFLNTSFQIQPDISLNTTASTLTASGLGITGVVKVSPHFTLSSAVFQGHAGDLNRNPHGFKYRIRAADGVFTIAEGAWNRSQGDHWGFAIRLGVWHHTGSFADVGHPEKNKQGMTGIYGISDLLLWKKDPSSDDGLGVFAKAGYAGESAAFIRSSVGAGIVGRGLIPIPWFEWTGIGITRAMLNPALVENVAYSGHETVLEWTASLLLHRHLSLQPDIQYIIHPGASREIPHTFASFIRMVAHF